MASLAIRDPGTTRDGKPPAHRPFHGLTRPLAKCVTHLSARWCHAADRARRSVKDLLRERRAASWGVAGGLQLLQLHPAHGEDHVDYRFEHYQEDDGRIGVNTQAWLVEKKITPWLALKGEVVYDAISGATPNGAPPSALVRFPFPVPGPLSTSVPTAYMKDERWAGVLDTMLTFGPHHITPQFSYSTEHDYVSRGVALNYALDLNEKNTTLQLGWSHNFDTVLPYPGASISDPQQKDQDDVLVGITQLLGPKTVLTADLTFRNAHGYLADPYRGVVFDDYPLADPPPFPEVRPSFRQSYIGYVSLTQYITPLHGSLEGSYRFFHDTWEINAHTFDLQWHQKIGKHVVISPLFRYYRQSAASFYADQFPGAPPPFNFFGTPTPEIYSADYRLSQMETFTFGVEASIKILERISLDFAYKRYEMFGLDHVTSPTAYPKANVFCVGARLWF